MTDFGGKLRQAREGRGISLRQIAANTKIAVAVLEALERNDISKLPGGIFSRAFVRSYAVEVGLDPDETVREFLDRFHGEPAPQPTLHVPVSEQEDLALRRHAMLLGLKVVGAVVLVAAIGGYFYLKSRRASSAPAVTEQAANPAPAANPPAAPATSASALPAPSLPAVATTGPMRLELHPSGDCWINLVVDGQTVLSRVMKAGERQTVTVRELATLQVGDAGAFAFSVDGRPGKALGAAGEVKTARLTRQTLAEYLR